jgi:hypothetical protein
LYGRASTRPRFRKARHFSSPVLFPRNAPRTGGVAQTQVDLERVSLARSRAGAILVASCRILRFLIERMFPFTRKALHFFLFCAISPRANGSIRSESASFFEFARFLIERMSPFARKARGGRKGADRIWRSTSIAPAPVLGRPNGSEEGLRFDATGGAMSKRQGANFSKYIGAVQIAEVVCRGLACGTDVERHSADWPKGRRRQIGLLRFRGSAHAPLRRPTKRNRPEIALRPGFSWLK